MLCIHACPVDAIVGSPKQMHTVLTEFCTGCDLCVPPCPVDCIDIVELERSPNAAIGTQPRWPDKASRPWRPWP